MTPWADPAGRSPGPGPAGPSVPQSAAAELAARAAGWTCAARTSAAVVAAAARPSRAGRTPCRRPRTRWRAPRAGDAARAAMTRTGHGPALWLRAVCVRSVPVRAANLQRGARSAALGTTAVDAAAGSVATCVDTQQGMALPMCRGALMFPRIVMPEGHGAWRSRPAAVRMDRGTCGAAVGNAAAVEEAAAFVA
jgi:hypothetical protein